ncbi:MAG: NUDIX hydrolase [Chthoniobacterales bacterium]
MNDASDISKNEHPQGLQLGWKLVESRYPFANEVLRLREDRLQVPGAESQTFAYVEQGTAVMIVPLTDDGQIVTIRQYRYPVDAHCQEVPAGKTSDVPELSLEEVAAKELSEEIGGTFTALEPLGAAFTNPSLGDEECHYFLARGVRLEKKKEPEPMEKIEIELVSAAEAVRLARQGGFRTAPAALAILLAEPRLRELGFI